MILKSANKLLLLNREKPSAIGLRNGVGGKIEPGETIEDPVCREVFEETGYEIVAPIYKGDIILHGEQQVGIHLSLAELSDDLKYDEVMKTQEGILAWKEIEWVLHPDNIGIISNLKRYLQPMLESRVPMQHVFHYSGHDLLAYSYKQMDETAFI